MQQQSKIMTIFYFLILNILFSWIDCQGYIAAINKTYPFRLGSATAYTFNTNNNYILNLSPELNFTPTTVMIAIHAYDNQITSGSSNLKIVNQPDSLSKTSFKIICKITRPTSYERIGFSYAFANPSWSVWNFYILGYTTSNSKTVTSSMIGNQPLSNIKGVTLKSFSVNYSSINSLPYAFNLYFNGSAVVISKNNQIDFIQFDACILTSNSSSALNQAYSIKWGTLIFQVAFNQYGSQVRLPLNDSLSSTNYIIGVIAAEWNNKNHMSFRFQQRVATMNLSFIWMSNSSYNSYSFFSMHFTIENCSNSSYPYLVYQLERCYAICPSGFFADSSSMRCKTCSIPNCTKCLSQYNCTICNSSFNFIIHNGKCVQCNPDPLNTGSTLPSCNSSYIPPVPTPDPDPSPQPQPSPEPQIQHQQQNESQSESESETAPQDQPEKNTQSTPQNQSQDEPIQQPEQIIDPIPQNETTTQQNTTQVFNCNLIRNNTVCSPFELGFDAAYALTVAVSIPTLSLLTSALSQMVGLLDDFSYYLYHNRQYSRLVIIYFEMANNFTLQRFYPPQLQSFISSVEFTYCDDILLNDLEKTPQKFSKLDPDIYFLKNMENFFIGTLIFSIVAFVVMVILNYLTNKCWKHKILKKYTYAGMFFVNLLGNNIQYISFRCFQQLYQTVPLSADYYGNLVVCYTLLFFTLVFSIAGITIFKFIYNLIKSEYVSGQLFQSSVESWFTISNLLKLFNGFTHAYFYGQSFIQEGLLTFSFSLKFFFYFFLIYRVYQKSGFVFDTIINFLMMIFQTLIFAELFLIQNHQYVQMVENKFGEIQFSILMLIFIAALLSMTILPMKSMIQVFKNHFCHQKPKTAWKCQKITECKKRTLTFGTIPSDTKKIIIDRDSSGEIVSGIIQTSKSTQRRLFLQKKENKIQDNYKIQKQKKKKSKDLSNNELSCQANNNQKNIKEFKLFLEKNRRIQNQMQNEPSIKLFFQDQRQFVVAKPSVKNQDSISFSCATTRKKCTFAPFNQAQSLPQKINKKPKTLRKLGFQLMNQQVFNEYEMQQQ